MDPKRKMGHRSARTKAAREESEKLKETEMEVDGESDKKVIRVESEETQDYLRETLICSQEEAEKMVFVPSTLGEPRGAIYWCDTRCSEKPSDTGR